MLFTHGSNENIWKTVSQDGQELVFKGRNVKQGLGFMVAGQRHNLPH